MDNLRVRPESVSAPDPLDGYRETDLGLLPEEWRVVTLEEVVAFARKPRGLRISDVPSVPFIAMEGIPADGTPGSEFVSKPGDSISSGTYCEAGDVLLAKITPSLENGKQGVVPVDLPDGFAMATTEVYPLKPRSDRLDTYFFFSYLRYRSVRRWLASKMEGSTGRQRLPKHVLSNLLIPLPSLEEQRTIAHVLRTIQEARKNTEQVIASAQELKRSLRDHLLTYGPVPMDEAERVALKESEVGQIPGHWALVKIGDVARVGNGSTPKRTNQAYWADGTRPWLTSGKVHETIIEHADEFVTEFAHRQCHLPVVPGGSVVVAITGQGKTLGNAALVTFDTSVSQHLAYLRFLSPAVHPAFVLAFLQRRYEDLRRAGREGGSTKGALTCGFLKSYSLPLPPLEEQQEIAHMLGTIDEKIAVEESRKQSLDILFKSLLHDLMTGKVRVRNLVGIKVEELV